MIFVVILIITGTACQLSSPTSTPTNLPVNTSVPIITNTVPEATSTNTVSPTSVPTLTETPENSTGFTPDVSADTYWDDRSTAVGTLTSYYNAINRHEYLRAYDYWKNPDDEFGSYEAFMTSQENIQNVGLTIGPVYGDAGAGQLHYAVGVILNFTYTDTTTQDFSDCFVFHISQPGIQATPPFNPLGIMSSNTVLLNPGYDLSAVLSETCSGTGLPIASQINPIPITNVNDFSNANYLDNRSDAKLLLNSYFNALNRFEYLRAYDYWENPADQQGTFNEFMSANENIAQVTASFGEIFSEGAAGNFYYRIPVAYTFHMNDLSSQYFFGCFTTHISSPTIQGVPPFRPLAIFNADITTYANASDALDQMAAGCIP